MNALSTWATSPLTIDLLLALGARAQMILQYDLPGDTGGEQFGWQVQPREQGLAAYIEQFFDGCEVVRDGGIRPAVESGVIRGGIMHACVRKRVPFVLAGSIRDDGPLPDTIMDLERAQSAYARAIEGVDMILMLSSMLHAIGTGNMTPAGVRMICVDISPAVVTKLADRGSLESIGVVTDVGLFLNLLAREIAGADD